MSCAHNARDIKKEDLCRVSLRVYQSTKEAHYIKAILLTSRLGKCERFHDTLMELVWSSFRTVRVSAIIQVHIYAQTSIPGLAKQFELYLKHAGRYTAIAGIITFRRLFINC